MWRNITLDEYVPARTDLFKPLFCNSKGMELWAILLEKAWAKLYKNYWNIVAGYLYEPLRALTGAPVVDYRLSTISPDEFFAHIYDYDKKRYSMMASSKAGSDTHTNNINIAMGHAYSLLGAAVVHVDGNDYKILRLRNPWGKGEGKGRFSDKDQIWDYVSPEVKAQIGYEDREDGSFFITLDDFYDSFSMVTVAKVEDDYSYVTCRQDHNFKNGMYFKVVIETGGTYSFQFEQTPFRSFEDKFSYKFNDLTLLVGRATEKGIQYMEGCYIAYQWAEKTYQLEPGSYVVYVKDNNKNKQEEPGKFGLSIYGQFLCRMQPASKPDCINFLPQYFLDGALQKGHKQ